MGTAHLHDGGWPSTPSVSTVRSLLFGCESPLVWRTRQCDLGHATAITLLFPFATAHANSNVDAIAAVMNTGAIPVNSAAPGPSARPLLALRGETVHITGAGQTTRVALDALADEVAEALGEDVTPQQLAEAIEFTSSAPGRSSTATVIDASRGNLIIDAGGPDSLSIGVPGQHAATEVVGDSTLASFDDGDVQYVLADAAGTSAAFAVIDSASAPTEYIFEITAGDQDIELELQDNGMVLVRGADGDVVNALLPAWAVDAIGEPVQSSYRIEGDSVIQDIELSGNEVFPVVADPSVACNYQTTLCSIYFNRTETFQIASGGATGAAVITAGCNWVPIWQVKLACAAGAVSLLLGSSYAWYAWNTGRCVGIQSQVLRGVWGIIYSCVKR